MTEDEAYIVKQRDFEALLRAGDKDALADLFEHPLPFIVETINGLIARGPKEWALAGGRVVQSVFNARLFPQVAAEIDAFRTAGKIPEDFAERPNGFQTWVELFTLIDEEAPDEERLDALKAMFLAVNQVNPTDAQKVVAYQLFQIAKKLNSNELLVIKAVYEMFGQRSQFPTNNFRDWAQNVATRLKHSMLGLIENADEALVDNKLLTPRQMSDLSSISSANCRLTDLGIEFCKNIERYHIEKKSLEKG